MNKFFKISIFDILTGQKRDRMAELKLVSPVNTTGHRSKLILSPGTGLTGWRGICSELAYHPGGGRVQIPLVVCILRELG